MKKLILIAGILLGSCSYGYSPEEISRFNTPVPAQFEGNVQKCWKICARRISRIEAMQKAIDFYKAKSKKTDTPSKKRGCGYLVN